ncbi:DUF2589 domain-containing protein [Fluviicola taffensis]|uniref:DUF2589 domain-containing protein n=1 Tax=Fluviicola taffensis TaxID=191579 RepID=UPI003137E677
MSQELVSMAQQFSGLPMDSLIGGPLNAAAKANAAMALTQTKFMLDTCFKKVGDKEANDYEPIMIKMSLERGVITPPADENGVASIQSVTTQFNLPLLTIVPLNSLAVDDVKITFEMEVKSSYGEEHTEESTKKSAGEGSFEAKIGYGPFSATIKGSASYSSEDKKSMNSHYEKSNSAKYTVEVHAAQLPLPKGVNTIIEAFAKSIEPIQLPAKSGGNDGSQS